MRTILLLAALFSLRSFGANDLTVCPLDKLANLPATQSAAGWSRFLPDGVHRFLAKRVQSMQAERAQRLVDEVRELLPPSATSFMLFMPQTSQGYLVHELPEGKTVQKKVDKSRPVYKWQTPEDAKRSAWQDAQEKEWFKRISDSRKKLLEAQKLLESQNPPDDATLAAVSLYLGTIDSFSYGFVGAMEKGRPGWQDLFTDASHRSRVEEATVNFEKALEIFTRTKGEKSPEALATRFLLGKHAVNAAIATSNSGSYEFSGQPVAPEPGHRDNLAKASSHLRSVMNDLASEMAPDKPFSGSQVLYLEAAYHLSRAEKWKARSPKKGKGDQSAVALPASSTVEDVLKEVLSRGTPEWIQGQIGDRYSLLARLTNTVRWGYDNGRARDGLYDLEQILNYDTNAKYEDVIEKFRAAVGYPPPSETPLSPGQSLPTR